MKREFEEPIRGVKREEEEPIRRVQRCSNNEILANLACESGLFAEFSGTSHRSAEFSGTFAPVCGNISHFV